MNATLFEVVLRYSQSRALLAAMTAFAEAEGEKPCPIRRALYDR